MGDPAQGSHGIHPVGSLSSIDKLFLALIFLAVILLEATLGGILMGHLMRHSPFQLVLHGVGPLCLVDEIVLLSVGLWTVVVNLRTGSAVSLG